MTEGEDVKSDASAGHPASADGFSEDSRRTSADPHGPAGASPHEPLAVGLRGASPEAEQQLRSRGIDPRRLSISRLGRPGHLLWRGYPRWGRRIVGGLLLWGTLVLLERQLVLRGGWLNVLASLTVGLLVLQGACDALVTASERLAARLEWDHYVAGSVAEILSTLPELVVIGFIVPVSPWAALVIALVTIYNNALIFSLYSYFLPKDQKGQFLMPTAITGAGTQILIAGAALGSIVGLVLLVFSIEGTTKQSFHPIDLAVLGLSMLLVFVVYVVNLLHAYSREEGSVRDALGLDARATERRRELVYEDVKEVSSLNLVGLLLLGVVAAFVGGERIALVAEEAVGDLGLDLITTSILLAGFAGMSEYVILWKAHRKGQHRIALANAFGGITQVMFLVMPFTLLAIALFQAIGPESHPDLPIAFNLSATLLFLLLFPVFFVLVTLLEEDHTLSSLDATIMTTIVALVLGILVAYGSG